MLLNLSNHPSPRWSPEQISAAEKQYGTVQDLPFPRIDPTLDHEAVAQLAADYHARITDLAPRAVHLMGELTFTFLLTQRLLAAGVNVVASTSERNVVEREGKKIVAFKFVRFRTYGAG